MRYLVARLPLNILSHMQFASSLVLIEEDKYQTHQISVDIMKCNNLVDAYNNVSSLLFCQLEISGLVKLDIGHD